MTRPKLTLFLDPISPFAHMAFFVVRTNATFEGCDVELVPVFLGGIMQASGNKPPLTVPNKGAYLGRDRARWVKRFNIPMAEGFPDPFPQSTIQASRALCVVQQKYPEKLQSAFMEVFNTMWVDLQPVGKPEVYSECLNCVFEKEVVDEIVKMTATPEIKKKLNDNTEYALSQGCFGLPYYIATNAKGESETFWGFDHLGQVVDHLGLERTGDGFRPML